MHVHDNKCGDTMQLIFHFFRAEVTDILHRYTSEVTALISFKKIVFFLGFNNFLNSILQSNISIKYIKNCTKCANASKSSGSIHSYHYFLRNCCAPTSLIAYYVLQKLEYCASVPKLKHNFNRICNIFHSTNIINF